MTRSRLRQLLHDARHQLRRDLRGARELFPACFLFYLVWAMCLAAYLGYRLALYLVR